MKRNTQLLTELVRVYLKDHSVLFYGALTGLCAYCAWQHLGFACLTYIVIGWAIYLPEEYFSHVLVFHGPKPQHPKWYRYLYRLHLGHHDKPRRVDLLFTPMWYTLPALGLNVLAFYWLNQGNWGPVFALSTGLITGYLLFEWWHLVVHSPYEPGPILRYVRQQHMGHHFWTERRWYTISPPAILLDILFDTAGPVHQAPRSANPKTDGLAESDPRLQHARQYYAGQSDGTEEESAIWLPTLKS